ncbi:hypothetical protein HMPREF1141_0529 [Clostridium sp. MSTE9]|nr:hypothetical protein HMPREF1141_0529 [Clostridium sp. MSTE9]
MKSVLFAGFSAAFRTLSAYAPEKISTGIQREIRQKQMNNYSKWQFRIFEERLPKARGHPKKGGEKDAK